MIHAYKSILVNTLRPRQNGCYFADDTFKCIFFNENAWISLKISLKFVPTVQIDNIIALVQIMAWRRPGDKRLSEPMMLSLLMHICITRPQWVKASDISEGHNELTLSVCHVSMLITQALAWSMVIRVYCSITAEKPIHWHTSKNISVSLIFLLFNHKRILFFTQIRCVALQLKMYFRYCSKINDAQAIFPWSRQ